VNPSPATTPPRGGTLRDLWALGFVVILLVLSPALLWARALHERSHMGGAPEGPVLTMVDEFLGGVQKTTICLVAVLAWLGFRRLTPLLSSLFLSSLPGMLIAAELGVVFWLVFGGLASIGMPGLFWSPDAWTMMRTALGVTLFVYWMLYLVFVHDFEAHKDEPERLVWHRLRPALETSGLPVLLRWRLGENSMVDGLRWFLAYAGLPALLALVIPAVLPAARPGGGVVIVEWPWLAGMALGTSLIAAIVTTRAATRLHALVMHLLRGQLNLRRLVGLDPERRQPNTNTWNILVIVTAVVLFSHLDQYVGAQVAMSPFPPAFSICVMFGVLATFATFLSTRTWFTRIISISVLVVLVAASGLLDYDVEIRDLHSWYPSAVAQLGRRVSSDPAIPPSYARVTNLESFQRSIPPGAADQAWRQREALLARWASSFPAPDSAAAGPARPIMVVVAASGGALRAAIWTETVLGALDQTFDDFHHHVRMITGASGGTLGGARYVCGHAKGTGVPGAPGQQRPTPDYLTPIAWQIAFRDVFPNSITPWATYNRGDALEDAWIAFDSGITQTFRDLKNQEDAGLIPSIVFSPMLVEDGRRLLISNLPLFDLTVNHGNVLTEPDIDLLRRRFRDNNPHAPDRSDPNDYDLVYPNLASVSAVEFFGLFGEPSRDKLKMASAVLMSSTFPYVTSAAALPTNPPRHVVDAGYYDNYGVNLAASWIWSHRFWISTHTSGVLLVQARAFRNERRLKMLDEEILAPPSDREKRAEKGWTLERVSRVLPWLISLLADGLKSVVLPVEGIARARDSSMYFRNDEQLVTLHTRLSELTGDNQFFRSVIFTCDTFQHGQKSQNAETLNWYIDPQECEEVRRGMEPYPEDDGSRQTGAALGRNYLRVKSLSIWWSSRGGKLKEAGKRSSNP
jgi:hypothetical protein